MSGAEGSTRLIRVLQGLTFLGFVVPNAMVVAFFVTNGFDLGGYFSLWVASLPSTQLSLDLILVSIAFAVWSAIDARRNSLRWWFVVPAAGLVGICYAVPLYLLQRERVLRRRSLV